MRGSYGGRGVARRRRAATGRRPRRGARLDVLVLVVDVRELEDEREVRVAQVGLVHQSQPVLRHAPRRSGRSSGRLLGPRLFSPVAEARSQDGGEARCGGRHGRMGRWMDGCGEQREARTKGGKDGAKRNKRWGRWMEGERKRRRMEARRITIEGRERGKAVQGVRERGRWEGGQGSTPQGNKEARRQRERTLVPRCSAGASQKQASRQTKQSGTNRSGQE